MSRVVCRAFAVVLPLLFLVGLERPDFGQSARAESAAVEALAQTAEHDAAGHSGAGRPSKPNILEVQPPLAFWTLIVFLLLLGLLWKFAWGPLSRALHDREHGMQETYRLTENARAESERLLAEHRLLIEQAKHQTQDMINQARKDAQTVADQVVHGAQEEAQATLQRARKEIASARDQALLDIWNRTADLAVSVAGKVLKRELSEDDHRRLVEEAIAELPTVPHNGHDRVSTGA